MDIVFHLLNNNDNNSRNDIKIYIVNMKSVIKSICIIDTTVRIQTKSNKIIEYNFDSTELAQQYYNSIIE